MKPLHFILLVFAFLPASAETVVINGRTIELPDSEVEGALQNQDITARLQAIKARVYNGTAVGKKANALLAKIRVEGLTDANVSALTELPASREVRATSPVSATR